MSSGQHDSTAARRVHRGRDSVPPPRREADPAVREPAGGDWLSSDEVAAERWEDEGGYVPPARAATQA